MWKHLGEYLLVLIGVILMMAFGILSPVFWMVPLWGVAMGVISGIVISATGVWIIKRR
ncbi:MAG: hypothetical protein PHQ86_05360 [Dehalococcoidales bacterium]|nr:hypothetical protein [Dehalococcoidales bacterium]